MSGAGGLSAHRGARPGMGCATRPPPCDGRPPPRVRLPARALRRQTLSDESGLEALGRRALQRYVTADDDLQRLLLRCPALLQADMPALLSFLEAYGVPDWRISQMLCTHPELLASRSVYEVGQLFQAVNQLHMFGESDLPLLLCCGATADSVTAMVAHLRADGLAQHDETLRMCLNRWPELLAADVERFAARITFLRGLEPLEGLTREQAARLRDGQLGWIPTAVDWDTLVQPRLSYISDVLGVEDTQAFLADCPAVLATPLFPTSDATRSLAGTVDVLCDLLEPRQLEGRPAARAPAARAAASSAPSPRRRWAAGVLRRCPAALAQSPLELRALCNFLVDVIGGGAEQVSSWPHYLALSLEKTVGPRYCFLHSSGLVGAFSSGASGALDLQRAFGVSLEALLQDAVAQRQGADTAAFQQAYDGACQQWQEVMGGSCVAAFSGLRTTHAARLNAFYMYLA